MPAVVPRLLFQDADGVYHDLAPHTIRSLADKLFEKDQLETFRDALESLSVAWQDDRNLVRLMHKVAEAKPTNRVHTKEVKTNLSGRYNEQHGQHAFLRSLSPPVYQRVAWYLRPTEIQRLADADITLPNSRRAFGISSDSTTSRSMVWDFRFGAECNAWQESCKAWSTYGVAATFGLPPYLEYTKVPVNEMENILTSFQHVFWENIKQGIINSAMWQNRGSMVESIKVGFDTTKTANGMPDVPVLIMVDFDSSLRIREDLKLLRPDPNVRSM